ncbi:MAG: cation diffusion facilitator family transporter [Clostridia bacterium]|nr:cation diffusion facilitator family transporter [Clostridia bacterium]
MEQAQYNIRARIGKLSGAVGIICNCLLAAGKLIVGHMTSSMSITADGLNNLSDGASSIVTLLGFKLAEKPADRKHPYGHARIEYIAGLTVAVMILFIGLELGKSSVEKLIDPEPIEFSFTAVWVLCASILVKLFMMLFNLKMGRKINSNALLATAADSRNDVMTTSAVLAASIVEHFYDVRIDGVMGIAVSLFILYSGIKLAGETMSPLLGEGANPELQKQITDYINGCPMVLGCHDLMVHDYGPGRRYASIHVEIDKNEDPMACHARIDRMERECLKNYGTHLVIHYDPVVTDDPEVNSTKRLVNTIIKVRDGRLTIHDFRMVDDGESVKMSFDMILPEDLRGQEQSIKETVEKALDSLDSKKYYADITFDMESEGAKED